MTSAKTHKMSIARPITSYAKVQTWVGKWVRNRNFQLRRPRVAELHHLDIGCGRNTNENLINMDYLWHPQVDICWDITRGLPFADGSMKGIFTEHCLEHFSLPMAFSIMKECHRILGPHGVFRVIVPDGGLYLRLYHQRRSGDASVPFPFESKESFEGVYSPILSVNRLYYQDRDSPFGHRCMYDFPLLELLLRKIGFTSVRQVGFRSGLDPVLCVDSENRRCESLYVEAVVAGGGVCHSPS